MNSRFENDQHASYLDEVEREFLRTKYGDAKARTSLGEDWRAKRKHADSSKFTEDRKPNPNYPRLNIEAELARTNYEMAHLVEMNTQLFRQIEYLMSFGQRIDLVEGAYAGLREKLYSVTRAYKESIDNHFNDRKKWRTEMSMRRVGLDPESAEDQLIWSQKLDEVTSKFLTTEKENTNGSVKGNGITGETSDVLPDAG